MKKNIQGGSASRASNKTTTTTTMKAKAKEKQAKKKEKLEQKQEQEEEQQQQAREIKKRCKIGKWKTQKCAACNDGPKNQFAKHSGAREL